MIRGILFWTHFSFGLLAGLFILIMSASGLLLTYERQMARAAQNNSVIVPENALRLSVEELESAALAAGAKPGHQMTLSRRPGDIVEVSEGRRNRIYLNPYTGDIIAAPAERLSAFFSRVTQIHRWLAFAGGRSEAGGTVMAISNLVFAGLLLTGAILWWPKKIVWPLLRTRLLLLGRPPTNKARNFNWHHVLAAWAFIPLLAIVISGVVISYGWAGNIMSALLDDRHAGGPGGQVQTPSTPSSSLAVSTFTLDQLVSQATEPFGNWKRVSLTLPADTDDVIRVSVDWGNGIERSRLREFSLARNGEGALSEPAPPASSSRRFFRFLHTGEVFGLPGQTIAGLASLASVLLVYTGISLALGRLTRMRKAWQVRKTASKA